MTLLLAGCQSAPRLDAAPEKDDKPAFVVVSQSPALDVRFRGITLLAAHTDPRQNRIALDFAQAVDGALFDQLQLAAPRWIDMAYGGYDNAVIHARQPGTFVAQHEADGFSLRFTPSETDLPLRGTAGEALQPDGVQKDEQPFPPIGAE
jgi:hypothetical protein